MNYISPLKLNSLGNLSQFQTGDRLPMKFGGVGPKWRGTVPVQSGTTIIPFDNTPPLITEGTQLWSQTVTPQGTDSVFKLTFNAEVDVNSTNKTCTIAIFRGSTMIGCRSTSASGYNGTLPALIDLIIYDAPATTGPITYSCRIGIDSGTWYLNQGNAQTMGGVNPAWWSVEEEL